MATELNFLREIAETFRPTSVAISAIAEVTGHPELCDHLCSVFFKIEKALTESDHLDVAEAILLVLRGLQTLIMYLLIDTQEESPRSKELLAIVRPEQLEQLRTLCSSTRYQLQELIILLRVQNGVLEPLVECSAEESAARLQEQAGKVSTLFDQLMPHLALDATALEFINKVIASIAP